MGAVCRSNGPRKGIGILTFGNIDNKNIKKVYPDSFCMYKNNIIIEILG